jgi:hypothetical protein
MFTVRVPIIATVVLLAILFAPWFTASVNAWQFTATGEEPTFDQALIVSFRKGKDVIAAGRVNDDPYVVRLARISGQPLWTFRQSGTGSGSESINAVDEDKNKHVIAAGVTSVQPSQGSQARFTVIKLDTETGVPHWFVQVGVGAALGVAVDANGDVLAAGQLDNEMAIVKLRGSDGVEMWRALAQGGGGQGQARALAIDGSGNAVAAGFIRNASSGADFAVVKVSGTGGTELWRHQVPSHPFSPGDEARAVAVDGAGDVVAAGRVRVFKEAENRLTREFTVIKLAGPDGAVRWRRDAGPGNDDVRGLALDAAGDVVAVGTMGFESAVVKLSGLDGTDMWRRLGDPASSDAVAVDGTGDVAVGGVVFVAEQRFNAVARKLAGATGADLWRTEINGPGNGDDEARAVAFDDNDDVAMGGNLQGLATGSDFAVVKLKGTDGTDF